MVNWSTLIPFDEPWKYYLVISSVLFGIGQLVQTWDFLKIRTAWGPKGVWTPNLIASEWQQLKASWWEAPLRALFFRHERFWHEGFYGILVVKTLAALSLFIAPGSIACALLLLTIIYTNLRWRGTYNGGSDMMSVVVGMGLMWSWLILEIASPADSSHWAKLGVYYIGIQSVISYFVAGIIKIKRPHWRSGEALKSFLNVSVFNDEKAQIEKIRNNPQIMRLLSWATLFFEIAFPLALFNTPTALFFITWAALFHLTNVYLFGLNRFFWAWAATWPCILIIGLR